MRTAKSAIEHVFADEQVDQRAMAEKTARKKIAQMGNLEPSVLRVRRQRALIGRQWRERRDGGRSEDQQQRGGEHEVPGQLLTAGACG